MILVTGASGQIGRMVLRFLIANEAPSRAFVRDAKSLKGAIPNLLDITVGDLNDPASLDAAMDGITTVFLMGEDSPRLVQQHDNVIQAALQHGVRRIVKLSRFGANEGAPVLFYRWQAEAEKHLEASGLDLTFIRPHLYMQNLLTFAPDIRDNKHFAAPMGKRAFSLVDARDVAEGCARALVEDGHEGRVYTLTGPDAITYDEIASLLSNLLKQPVTYDMIKQRDYYDILTGQGMPDWKANDLAQISAAYVGHSNSDLSDDLAWLIDREPRTIHHFLTDYLADFKPRAPAGGLQYWRPGS